MDTTEIDDINKTQEILRSLDTYVFTTDSGSTSQPAAYLTLCREITALLPFPPRLAKLMKSHYWKNTMFFTAPTFPKLYADLEGLARKLRTTTHSQTSASSGNAPRRPLNQNSKIEDLANSFARHDDPSWKLCDTDNTGKPLTMDTLPPYNPREVRHIRCPANQVHNNYRKMVTYMEPELDDYNASACSSTTSKLNSRTPALPSMTSSTRQTSRRTSAHMAPPNHLRRSSVRLLKKARQTTPTPTT